MPILLGMSDLPRQPSNNVNFSEIKNYIRHKENVTIYASPLSDGPKILLLLFSILGVHMAGYSFPETLWRVSLGELGGQDIGIMVPVLGLVPIAIGFWIFRTLYDSRYVIGMDAIVQVRGLSTFTSRATQIYFRNVRAIKVAQSLYQRFFDLGDVRIGDMFDPSAQTETDIIMRGIRHPEQVKSVIERRIRAVINAPAEHEQEMQRLSDRGMGSVGSLGRDSLGRDSLGHEVDYGMPTHQMHQTPSLDDGASSARERNRIKPRARARARRANSPSVASP